MYCTWFLIGVGTKIASTGLLGSCFGQNPVFCSVYRNFMGKCTSGLRFGVRALGPAALNETPHLDPTDVNESEFRSQVLRCQVLVGALLALDIRGSFPHIEALHMADTYQAFE